ncbi:unnamed protein product [Thelazia callipaeda]|uniref:Uncharacterized protein n=1 Tax=Thelazia callipaeda TaxID=103827 RepID=A0A0N5CTD4_THECL|nr:unnamed protein product [Thelazia callipaeda]
MAFPSEIYDCIKFLPDQQRGITFQEANEEESKAKIVTVYVLQIEDKKILAILSINILTSSSYSMYAFAESMLSGQLYEVVNRSNVAFIMNGIRLTIYFSLSLSFTMFSVRSIEFCFHTITKHTVQCDQSATVVRLLKCFGYLAYAIIVIVCIEIIATIFVSFRKLKILKISDNFICYICSCIK